MPALLHYLCIALLHYLCTVISPSLSLCLPLSLSPSYLALTTMRNPYRNNVDFAAIALRSPDFASCLTSSGQPDFSDPNSIRCGRTKISPLNHG
jgi:hypothetical protein